MRVRALAVVVTLAAAGVAAAQELPGGGSGPPAPTTATTTTATVPAASPPLPDRMAAADRALRASLPAWRRDAEPPAAVTAPAWALQTAVRRLARDPALARRTIPRLPPGLARLTREAVAAQRALWRLAAGWPPHKVAVGPAEPLSDLMSYYRAAQRRFGVGAHVLAAVNFVESAFGKVRNHSVAGARGPMQFMPATWRAYGLGGDLRDPHDAILGAANLLRHAGAPRSYAHALFAYNPSKLYVSAVRRYARLIDRDPAALPLFYTWRVIR
jgi:membrane-bound lytic murein transglycosylase B